VCERTQKKESKKKKLFLDHYFALHTISSLLPLSFFFFFFFFFFIGLIIRLVYSLLRTRRTDFRDNEQKKNYVHMVAYDYRQPMTMMKLSLALVGRSSNHHQGKELARQKD